MKTPQPDSQPGSDDEFITALTGFSLRPPPPPWRDEILAAAAVRPARKRPWHRSPWLRGMAAAWVVSLGLWADTWRMSPQPASFASMSVDSDRRFNQRDWQSLLALLEESDARHRHSLFSQP